MNNDKVVNCIDKMLGNVADFAQELRDIKTKINDSNVDVIDDDITTSWNRMKRRLHFNIKKIMLALWQDSRKMVMP